MWLALIEGVWPRFMMALRGKSHEACKVGYPWPRFAFVLAFLPGISGILYVRNLPYKISQAPRLLVTYCWFCNPGLPSISMSNASLGVLPNAKARPVHLHLRPIARCTRIHGVSEFRASLKWLWGLDGIHRDLHESMRLRVFKAWQLLC